MSTLIPVVILSEVTEKAKLLRVRNIRFFHNTKELSRYHNQLALLTTVVQIIFEFPKKINKNNSNPSPVL